MAAPTSGIGDGDDRGRALFGDESGPDFYISTHFRTNELFINDLSLICDLVAARQLNSNQPFLFKIFHLAPLESSISNASCCRRLRIFDLDQVLDGPSDRAHPVSLRQFLPAHFAAIALAMLDGYAEALCAAGLVRRPMLRRLRYMNSIRRSDLVTLVVLA